MSFPLSSIEIRKSNTFFDERWSKSSAPLFAKRSARTRASVDGLCIESTLNAYFMEKVFKKNFDDIQDQLKDIYRTSWIQSEM